MSRKTNRKQVIAQLVKDPQLMEAFERIRQSVTNNRISIEDIFGSDEELSDNDNDDSNSDADNESDDSEVPELCNHTNCNSDQCHKNKKTKINKVNNGQTEDKPSDKAQIRERFKQLFLALLNDNNGESDDEAEDGSQSVTPDQKSTDNAIDMLTEKERKKRKSEKKKLQKKKKKEKRKAEKEMIESIGQNSKSDPKTKANDKNNTNRSNNQQKIPENSNTSKTDTKTDDKQKMDKNGDKSGKHKKESDVGNNSKANSHESLSAKSSPKSEFESESWYQSDAEEEELLFNSAYVSQIAQRMNKPSYKSAQTVHHNKAQDLRENNTSPVVAKRKAFSDNNSVHSNSSDSYRNNMNFANHNTSRTTLPSSNSSKDADEDFPKYKQYFFDNQKVKPAKQTTVVLTKEEISQNKEKSVDLAKLANYKAENGLFVEAIDLFSQAIDLNSKDYRFYVNRSYCFDSIQDYRNALKDAEIAIKLKSDWPKCHYRKGKALAGLKNYQESEIALKKVLQLESNCQEALQELKKVRENAIIDMGYDATTADQYSNEYESISEALKALSLKYEKPKALVANNKNPNITRNGNNWWNAAPNPANAKNGPKSGHSYEDDDIYISDDEYNCIRPPSFQETESVHMISPFDPINLKLSLPLDQPILSVGKLFGWETLAH